MAVSMYTISAPVFVQILSALSNVIDKAEAHCEAKKLDQSFFMNNRLYPDMFPFLRQVRSACDHAVNACARIAGVEVVFAGRWIRCHSLRPRYLSNTATVTGSMESWFFSLPGRCT